MSIVTGTGDDGDTGVIRGPRVPKDDPRIDAYGTVDELNAALAHARSEPGLPDSVGVEIDRIGHWLFDLGCDLATPGLTSDANDTAAVPLLAADRSRTLEEWVHREEASLPPLRNFILPGGCPAAARLHVARTVCRRAERAVVTLRRATGEARVAMVFLNRLSDLLFVYARRANLENGVPDVEWMKQQD